MAEQESTTPSTPEAQAAADARGAADIPGDVEKLLTEAEEALASINEPAASTLPPNVRPFTLESLSAAPGSHDAATLDLLDDVQLNLKIELGRTHMHLEDVLKLRKGSVVALDKSAGDPVDIYVNGRMIARGEVLVLNENFCVRVAELLASDAQMHRAPG